jgi:frataxin-like iron-binding protein CyaY
MSEDNITNLDDYRKLRKPESIGIGIEDENIILEGENGGEIVINKAQARWLAIKLLGKTD